MDRIGAGMHVVPTLSRPVRRGRGRPALVRAVLASAGVAAGAVLLAGTRVVVEGDSMEPTLAEGDRLVVVRLPRRLVPVLVRRGQLVTARDPRRPARLLVKRVASVGPGTVELTGDNPARSTDSRTFGPVAAASVRGVVAYRYAPAGRAGLLRAGSPPRGGPPLR